MKKLSILLVFLMLLTGCGAKNYTGKIEVITGAKDEEFAISTEAAILYREVEMLQWIDDENGPRKVFANYQIDSFEKDGVKYENPEFPIESKIFIGESKIGEYTLSEDVLKAIMFSDVADVKTVSDLPAPLRSDIDLIKYEDSYVTASNDWEIGEIRITFKELKDDSSFNISGKVEDGVITLTSDSEISK